MSAEEKGVRGPHSPPQAAEWPDAKSVFVEKGTIRRNEQSSQSISYHGESDRLKKEMSIVRQSLETTVDADYGESIRNDTKQKTLNRVGYPS